MKDVTFTKCEVCKGKGNIELSTDMYEICYGCDGRGGMDWVERIRGRRPLTQSQWQHYQCKARERSDDARTNRILRHENIWKWFISGAVLINAAIMTFKLLM